MTDIAKTGASVAMAAKAPSGRGAMETSDAKAITITSVLASYANINNTLGEIICDVANSLNQLSGSIVSRCLVDMDEVKAAVCKNRENKDAPTMTVGLDELAETCNSHLDILHSIATELRNLLS